LPGEGFTRGQERATLSGPPDILGASSSFDQRGAEPFIRIFEEKQVSWPGVEEPAGGQGDGQPLVDICNRQRLMEKNGHLLTAAAGNPVRLQPHRFLGVNLVDSRTHRHLGVEIS